MLTKRAHSKRTLSTAIIALLFVLIALLLTVNSDKLHNEKTTSDVPVQVGKCDDYVRFLDVGQGDCALITSNGVSMLIDTGTPEGADELCAKLKKYGITDINTIMLSHFHNDHAGGIDAVTSRFNVSNLIYPDPSKSDSMLSGAVNAKKTVLAEDGELYIAKQGMVIKFGDCELTVLGYFGDESDENDRSVFAMAEIHGKKFLFTGDAGKAAEKRLLSQKLNIKCNVLKVGHHGSNTSSTEDFLAACSPEYASISCGLGNIYSHPGEATIARLEEKRIEFYRTDLNGDITFAVDSNGIYPSTEK